MKPMEHHPYHERCLEQQMLDALLRIEAILERAFPEAPLEKFAAEREDVFDPDGHKVGSVKKSRRK